MEVHPEQVEVKKMGIHGNGQLLESMAKKVEQEEGRGQFKVSHLLLCTHCAGLVMLNRKRSLQFFTNRKS